MALNLEAMQRWLAVQEDEWHYQVTFPGGDTDPEWVADQRALMRAGEKHSR